MAVLTIQPVTIPETVITPVTPSGTALGSDSVPAGQNQALYISNTSGASRTVNIKTPQTVYGQAVPDIAVVLATNGFRIVRLPPELQENDGLIKLGCDNTAGLVYAAISV